MAVTAAQDSRRWSIPSPDLIQTTHYFGNVLRIKSYSFETTGKITVHIARLPAAAALVVALAVAGIFRSACRQWYDP
jgi:hypothetical protein